MASSISRVGWARLCAHAVRSLKPPRGHNDRAHPTKPSKRRSPPDDHLHPCALTGYLLVLICKYTNVSVVPLCCLSRCKISSNKADGRDRQQAFDFHKYGFRYLAYTKYRFNRSFDLTAIPPRLLRATTQRASGPSSGLSWLKISANQEVSL